MRKLIIPKHAHKGLKIYCKTCRTHNPKCKHYDRQVYNVRIHVPGTKHQVKCKNLVAENYNDAVIECIEFEKELKQYGFENPNLIYSDTLNDYNIADAIIKFREFMSGESKYAHLKKNLSQDHIDESIRFCWLFVENIALRKNIKLIRPTDIKPEDVSNFYVFASKRYSASTFNKCLNTLRRFFEFFIEIENMEMKNPFRNFVSKVVTPPNIDTITEEEFNLILEAVDTCSPIQILDGKTKNKNRFRPFLKNGFKLFLLTGGRREEVVNLKWSDIFSTSQGVKLFIIDNQKVNKIKKDSIIRKKYIGINADLENFLIELGMNEKMGRDEYILYPDRKSTTKSIMNDLSKGFSHFKNMARIDKNISLSNLRKTYLTWHHQVLGSDTGLVSSHSTTQVLEKYYLDPKVLTAVELSALKVRVFGKTNQIS